MDIIENRYLCISYTDCLRKRIYHFVVEGAITFATANDLVRAYATKHKLDNLYYQLFAGIQIDMVIPTIKQSTNLSIFVVIDKNRIVGPGPHQEVRSLASAPRGPKYKPPIAVIRCSSAAEAIKSVSTVKNICESNLLANKIPFLWNENVPQE